MLSTSAVREHDANKHKMTENVLKGKKKVLVTALMVHTLCPLVERQQIEKKNEEG